jgi:NAD-dependent deacetylase
MQPPDAPLTRLEALLARTRPERIVVVTGAGISVASGIPMYRDADGYWSETSANYEPESTAYLASFRERPQDVWQFCLRQRALCVVAAPNRAHAALVRLEQLYGDGFLLVTQNVDGLHRRAGNSAARTIEAHGSVDFMRPLEPREGEPQLLPIPDELVLHGRSETLSEASWARLRTADGRLTRPHTMFFDEPYDQQLYRSQEAFDHARKCDLLLVIGTSGATAMPWHLAVHAREADAAIICVDPNETPFGVHARNRERADKGLWLQGTSEEWVPRIVELLERR